MKIAIIGSGHIGGTLARLLIQAGHEVALANSRGPLSLTPFVEEFGEKLHPVTTDQAVAYSDLIILSIPWRTIDNLPVYHTPGKTIVDTTNPYKGDGTIYDLGNDISSSKVMQHFTGASIVKAFNTIWFKHLEESGNKRLPVEKRRVIPFAGDDVASKVFVARLIEEIGFGPLDTGSLHEGSKVQNVGAALYNKELTVEEAKKIGG